MRSLPLHICLPTKAYSVASSLLTLRDSEPQHNFLVLLSILGPELERFSGHMISQLGQKIRGKIRCLLAVESRYFFHKSLVEPDYRKGSCASSYVY
jgi:hypothetical protein